MIDTNEFGETLKNLGFCDFSGVPCSYLAPLINYTMNQKMFISSNNEGDAVAIASGISLANLKKARFGAVLMQNSGLSNALSPLTSLNHTFKIPILGFVSLRGERENGKNTDEPQHELMGAITDKILKTCEIKYEFLDSNNFKKQLESARNALLNKDSFFFIVRKNTFFGVNLESSAFEAKNLGAKEICESSIKIEIPDRFSALKVINEIAREKNCALIATTGKTGRELYEIGDTENQFYMVGSMGCASSLALGASLKSCRKIIAIDGDSALLMRMGALSTNAYYAKSNFCHILLDNQSHDSTGAQSNLSPFVCFPNLARACGYSRINVARNLLEFKSAILEFIESKQNGAHFIYLRINKGSKKDLGRPKIHPREVALRFSAFLEEKDEIL